MDFAAGSTLQRVLGAGVHAMHLTHLLVIFDFLLTSLGLLQDKAKPRPFHVVDRTLRLELGAGAEEVFAEFSAEATAAASLAQVGLGRLERGDCAQDDAAAAQRQQQQCHLQTCGVLKYMYCEVLL